MKARNLEVGVVANDIVTQEDAERIKRSGLIDPARVLAVETGACPHTAIREDPTLNIQAVESLVESFPELDVVLVESGGDNLARARRLLAVRHRYGGRRRYPAKARPWHSAVGSPGDQQDRPCALCRGERRSDGG
jgi:predicted TIM-barrel fold metal-dependent hydrolase